MSGTFSIGRLSKRAQVNIETIRFYERKGLLPEPERRESGYRKYTDDAVGRLIFIRHGKELGFSLAEIADLLTLRVDPRTTCADVKLRTDAKIVSVREKIISLQKIEQALINLSADCKGLGPTSECPILEALEMVGEA
ncbi:MAG: heavy metal-responsive transcriptional regulator [Candidatus Marinimicrobia bacterium]|nr:heavy metal-responsive transcriptional regulator [Candidatus Neomarinimicrobiota bacterium]